MAQMCPHSGDGSPWHGCPHGAVGSPWHRWVPIVEMGPHGMDVPMAQGGPYGGDGSPWHRHPHGTGGSPWHGYPHDGDEGSPWRDDPIAQQVPHSTLWWHRWVPAALWCPTLTLVPVTQRQVPAPRGQAVQAGRGAPRRGAVCTHRGDAPHGAPHRWYHGPIGRAGAETLLALCREGSFLVRDCETSPDDYSLSLRYAVGRPYGAGVARRAKGRPHPYRAHAAPRVPHSAPQEQPRLRAREADTDAGAALRVGARGGRLPLRARRCAALHGASAARPRRPAPLPALPRGCAAPLSPTAPGIPPERSH